MANLLVKYWAGWLSTQNMDNPGYLDAWKKTAQAAEEEGMELAVFRLPKGGQAVKIIETMLQANLTEPEK